MPSILVVDDSPLDRRLIGHLLTQEDDDWQVEFANDGQEAIELFGKRDFDLVVTDLQMPRVDGLGLVKAVREQKPHIPVLLVTSQGSQEVAFEALRLGAINYSPKSKLSKDLLGTAKHVLDFAKQINQVSSNACARNNFSFVLENDSDLIAPIIKTLEANLPDWTEADRLRIGMAINEAVTNAIYHGNLEVDSELRVEDESRFYELVKQRRLERPYSLRRVRLNAEFTADRIEVSVLDQGPGFNPARVADPTCPENLERLCGRGLLLIRSFMDEVRHNNRGNRISMVKKRPA